MKDEYSFGKCSCCNKLGALKNGQCSVCQAPLAGLDQLCKMFGINK